MTGMYQSKHVLFPKVESKKIKKAMNETYTTQGRVYDIYNYAESQDSIFLELIESYPVKNKLYRTPLALVIYFNVDGKIKLGRHYCDPKIYNNKNATQQKLHSAHKKQKVKVRISEKGIENFE